eukprot:GAFH01001052.1.p2 GENE.GAFH01001052.1~~GAFH01001052.1.p2  ORF type:complete len:641 (-),score=243.38 GAFH01001052.1:133-1776(-)
MFRPEDRMELLVYTSLDSNAPSSYEHPIWQKKLTYGDGPSNNIEYNYTFTAEESTALKSNQSLYVHAFLCRAGRHPDPASPAHTASGCVSTVHAFNRHIPRGRITHNRNLLAEEHVEISPEQLALEEAQSKELVSVLVPVMALTTVFDTATYTVGRMPPQVVGALKLRGTSYAPIFYVNEFWVTSDDLVPLNESTPDSVMQVRMSHNVQSPRTYQFLFSMLRSFEMQGAMMGMGESDIDSIKHMLKDTNPLLLGVTVLVTLLHSVFDFLAFKNDISFWKNNKNLEGLSVRSIFLNIGQNAIIFLYLLDSKETSTMILISNFVSLVIEVWKLKKAVILEVKWYGNLPYLTFKDRSTYSSRTKEHDVKAHRWLMITLVPLVIGYSIYSLIYESHKSWYSWILASLVGTVYTFGFIAMTPQLFINYKLKSVAHLPWKTFIYKFLNTIVDDFFAFIIKMPLLHRIACFRDDVVFVIFLVQWWIYPVDKTRANEFGQSFEEPEEEKKKEDSQPAPAATAAAAAAPAPAKATIAAAPSTATRRPASSSLQDVD